MKFTAALALLLLASSFAFSSFDYNSEYDLIEDLKDQDDKIYVLFFYASANLHPIGYEQVHHHYVTEHKLKERTDDEHDAIKSYADVTRDIYYNEFDVINIQHDAVIHELGVEKAEIFSWPVTVVVKNGEGFQVTGPNSVYFVKRIVDNLRDGSAPAVQPGEYDSATDTEPVRPNTPQNSEPVQPAPVQPEQPKPVAEQPVKPVETAPEEEPVPEKVVETVELSDNPFDEQPAQPVAPAPVATPNVRPGPPKPAPTPSPRPGPTPERPGPTPVARPTAPVTLPTAPVAPGPTPTPVQRPAGPGAQVRPGPPQAAPVQPRPDGGVPVQVNPAAGATTEVPQARRRR